MTASVPAPKSRILSARRLVLLAGVAGLGATVLLGGPGFLPQPTNPSLSAVAYAQGVQRPMGFADIVDKVKPAVISVRVKVAGGAKLMGFEGDSPLPPNVERFFRRFGLPEGVNPEERRSPRERLVTGQGSGFFISADGYAVTNNHVVDKADTVEVTADDGKTYTAKVIGTDPRTDIAVIKVEGRSDFPYVQLAEKAPRIGDWVLAVGNPFGLGGTVTAGIVSARGRDIGAGPYDDFIQIDAPVNKGNSGGPTFDVDGNVIGVNTAIFSPSGGSVGIAFAIPAPTVKTVVAQLKESGKVTRGWIGVQIQPVTAEIADNLGLKTPQGALVAEPQANSPAATAGIMAGDVITAVNGSPVKDARDLAKQIGNLAPGSTVKLTVWRKGEEKTFSVALGELPNQREARGAATPDSSGPEGTDVPRLGLTVVPAGQVAGSGSEGVVVTEVDPNGIASDQGVKTGDVILEVGGKKVANPSDVRSALREAQKEGKRTILMRVKSGDATRFVALRLGKA
ncbi:MAG TPA: Do family serine endopeptidase [Xanthobacteraceae bacterium]|jgi:serine protease Do|nr:Do family serine endopeptidase [Xanthobacteraceae bacterium]